MSVTTDGRRFGGVGRLYGEGNALRLRDSHVVVVGMGGVGSWSVEALARTGIGRLTLIDGDSYALSNTNRQLCALDGNYGKSKAEAQNERIRLINPDCSVEVIPLFVKAQTIEGMIPDDADWVIDCIDDLAAKALLIGTIRGRGQKICTAGGAGARIDPSRVTSADLARAKGDPLLGKLRTMLRKEYGFPSGSADGRSKLFGVPAVFSDEPLRQPGEDSLKAAGAAPGERIGFGSGVVVTATAGLRLASIVINDIVGSQSTAA